MKKGCTCIIPFYNEEVRILQVLKIISKVKNIREVICSDDGSTDRGADRIQRFYPNVKILRSPENRGKARAIKEALKHAKHDLILLHDADVINSRQHEIEFAIDAAVHSKADMIILRRVNEMMFDAGLTRLNILWSGERILRKKDLKEIYRRDPSEYQIEAAINQYMLENNKTVKWVASSAENTFKFQKMKPVRGMLKEIEMFYDIISYLGIRKFVQQSVAFCRDEVKV